MARNPKLPFRDFFGLQSIKNNLRGAVQSSIAGSAPLRAEPQGLRMGPVAEIEEARGKMRGIMDAALEGPASSASVSVDPVVAGDGLLHRLPERCQVAI